jgi:hypothetical protein
LDAVRGPVDCEPLVGSVADQPPDAVQDAALTELQFKVALLPLLIVLGDAVNETVGALVALTVTVADCAAEPPGPVQVNR